MKNIIIVIVFFCSISTYASLKDFGIKRANIIKLSGNMIVLDEPTTIMADKVIVDTKIITNGKQLEIGAYEIEFTENGKIYAFGEHLAEDYAKSKRISVIKAEEILANQNSCFSGHLVKPKQQGTANHSVNPLTRAHNATGHRGAGHGVQGYHGAPGKIGGRGEDGLINPQPIVLLTNRFIGHNPTVNGNGQKGADGGDGQHGQSGFKGQDGGHGYAFCYRNPFTKDISRRGGNGGKGGFGGKGGAGGDGGVGGSNSEVILIHGGTEAIFDDQKFQSVVGEKGIAGRKGNNGNPGAGGKGGNGDFDRKWIKIKIFGKTFKTEICRESAGGGADGPEGKGGLNSLKGCENINPEDGSNGQIGCEYKFKSKPVVKSSMEALEKKYSQAKKDLLRHYFYKRFALIYFETLFSLTSLSDELEELVNDEEATIELTEEAQEEVLHAMKDWNKYFIQPLKNDIPVSSKTPLSRSEIKTAINKAKELLKILRDLYKEKKISTKKLAGHKAYFITELEKSLSMGAYSCKELVEMRNRYTDILYRDRYEIETNENLKSWKQCVRKKPYEKQIDLENLKFYNFGFSKVVDQLYALKSCETIDVANVTKMNVRKIITSELPFEKKSLISEKPSFCGGLAYKSNGARSMASNDDHLNVELREVKNIIEIHERLYDSETPLEIAKQEYKLQSLKMPEITDVRKSRGFHLKITSSLGGAR